MRAGGEELGESTSATETDGGWEGAQGACVRRCVGKNVGRRGRVIFSESSFQAIHQVSFAFPRADLPFNMNHLLDRSLSHLGGNTLFGNAAILRCAWRDRKQQGVALAI